MKWVVGVAIGKFSYYDVGLRIANVWAVSIYRTRSNGNQVGAHKRAAQARTSGGH